MSSSTETVRTLAREILVTRGVEVLPILADALEDAGCEDVKTLRRLRTVGTTLDSILATFPRRSHPSIRTIRVRRLLTWWRDGYSPDVLDQEISRYEAMRRAESSQRDASETDLQSGVLHLFSAE